MDIKKPALAVCAAAAVVGYVAYGNTAVGVTRYAVTDKKLPPAFSGYRIMHISDLHNTAFGKNNRRLIRMIKDEAPDMIAITGDTVDALRTDIEIAAAFAQQIAGIAPVYCVTGNHEGRIGALYAQLEARLISAGVTVLRDACIPIQRDGDVIHLIGLDDPRFIDEDLSDSSAVLDDKLRQVGTPEGYSVLLSHRPEAFGTYVSHGIGLALCGHAHGGQIRIPFAGGLFAPHQGFFPKYDAGMYQENGTAMIVSRGLGNSQFPFRLNDRPELVTVELLRG